MPKLRPFQREDINRIKAARLRALVASAPGTGKTPIAIRSVAETHRVSLPAVVVCPASVTINWVREIRKWAPGLKPVLVTTTQGKLPKKHQAIYVMSWSLLDLRWGELVAAGVKTVIADEAHYAKNPDAMRSQALYQIAQACKHVLLLTGTPIVNTRDELRVLNELLGEKPLMIRRLIEDVAKDIPEKKRSYAHIRLRDKHQSDYDKASDDFETWLRNEKERLLGEGLADFEIERTMAAEALAKIGYLRRLVGQYKVPAALDWIARAVRIGEPVVVFVEHQECLTRLSRGLNRMRIRHCVVEGSTSAKNRQQAVDDFQNNKYPVFIGTKAAKEGITLTAARHLLFVERFFTSADEEQAEDRIRRIGQKHRTTIWYLHAVGTIDDRLDAIVSTKRVLVRSAIGAANTAVTDTSTVESMLQAWSRHTHPDVQVTELGLGKPLPPLPSPKITHGVVFSGTRWTKQTAAVWCKMHGYKPDKLKMLSGRMKIVIHPAEVFRPNQFELTRVCKDVRIITGKRLSRANERRVRMSLRAAR
jgi:SNF2 family DNA or RNA helicase